MVETKNAAIVATMPSSDRVPIQTFPTADMFMV
jgi:hypothetical protein